MDAAFQDVNLADDSLTCLDESKPYGAVESFIRDPRILLG
jgi:hypothetical protein